MKRTLLALFCAFTTGIFAQGLEGFENLTFPPPGWTVMDNGIGTEKNWQQITLGSPVMVPHTGNYAAWIDKENVPDGTFAEDWLISPAYTVPPNAQLSFYSRFATAGDQGSILKVMISTGDPADLGSYALLQQYTETSMNPVQDQYTKVTVDVPTVYESASAHFALVMVNDDGDRWFVDDFIFGEGCATPEDLVIMNIGLTTFDISWNPGMASSWEVLVLPADAPFNPNESGIVVTAIPYTVTGLVEGSFYKAYVRAVCANGIESGWAGPVYTGTYTGNTLSGSVTYDADGDTSCEPGQTLPFLPIAVYKDGLYAYTAYTNINGNYVLDNMDDGVYTVTLQPILPDAFPTTAGTSVTVDYSAENTDETADICLQQPQAVNDIGINLVPASDARPGFNTTYYVVVTNYGSVNVSNITATISYDSSRQGYISSTGVSSSTESGVEFLTGSLQAYSSQVYSVTLYTFISGITLGGEVLEFNATITGDLSNDENPEDNEAVLYQTIVNSWDPNDITVHEGPEITPEQADGYLTYTIRFENTGTADAINIRVMNTLDEKLDWDTFQPLLSSHEYSVRRNEDDVEFIFTDINLPPSDDSGSSEGHGFITYRIKPVDNVIIGDVFYNYANIFFDFNEPVLTNTAETEIVQEVAGLDDFATAQARLYPNPAGDMLNVVSNSAVQNVVVYDLNGRECFNAQSSSVNVSKLAPGLYLATITTAKGTSVYKFVKD